MSRRCSISGKQNRSANNVSHSNRKTKRVQKANIQTKRLFVPELGRHVKVKLSTRMIRTLNKKSLPQLLKEHGLTWKDIGVEV